MSTRTDGWNTVEEGPFGGWLTWVGDPFETLTGPYYYRTDDDGTIRGAFIPETKHLNGGGIVHGGALMTFADAMLGALVYLGLNNQFAVTVTFNTEFVGTGTTGAPSMGRAESCVKRSRWCSFKRSWSRTIDRSWRSPPR